ncbi:MAG: KH domain-containing protein, partial [Candidatus Hodarchaeota archaeon]
MKQELVIPRNRIGVIIGPNGATKTLLEQRTQTTINVDSLEGTIIIESDTDINPDPMATWIARDIIRAISRGFNPTIALKLLDEDIFFDFVGIKGTPKYIQRMKGR